MPYRDHKCDDCGVTCKNEWPIDKGWNSMMIRPLNLQENETRDFVYLCPSCSNKILDKFPSIRFKK